MTGLIQKSGYIKPGGGGAGNYARYIATRDGVELVTENMQTGERYMKYIAERPRSHGLFSAEPVADLEKTMEEVSSHPAPVWTFIYSLKREDAERLGYNSAKAWRDLLRAHRNDIAAAMNIPPADFRWYAAFHDEGEHPHVHMMAWSVKPGQAYLNTNGIRKIKSELTNEIFRDEMLSLYGELKEKYDRLVELTKPYIFALPHFPEKVKEFFGKLLPQKERAEEQEQPMPTRKPKRRDDWER